MDETEKKTDYLDKFAAWAEKDWWVILLFTLCLGACLFTMASVATYQEKINNAWEEQWEQSGCAVSPSIPNISYNVWGKYNETKD